MVVIDSFSEIERKLGIYDNGPAQKFLAATCYRYMDQYVPKRDGLLRGIVDLNNSTITYMSPYASYQYYGMREDGTHVINPENYTTPGTGPYWDQRMLSAHKNQVIKEVEQYIGSGVR